VLDTRRARIKAAGYPLFTQITELRRKRQIIHLYPAIVFLINMFIYKDSAGIPIKTVFLLTGYTAGFATYTVFQVK
jgi:hypothetical protein